MMNKRILLISGNFYPEPTGIGKYNGEMIDLLASEGNHCTVVTSYPYYPFWSVQEPYKGKSSWYKKEIKQTKNNIGTVEIHRCPQYVPHKPTAKRRMLLDFTFCFFAMFKIFQLLFNKRYDYVITVVPCFQIGLLGVLYKKVRGGKFLYYIQDLQIDIAKELKMIKSKLLLAFLLRIEKYILEHADVVSSISPGMINRIKNKFNRDVFLFPNWVDTKTFFPLEEKELLKEEFNFSNSDKIILYSGAIGEKQGLEAIMYAAQSLKGDNRLKFVICGSGPYREKLELLKESCHLSNVVFLPLQPSERLNRFLNMADIHLVLQKGNATDLVMPSKLTNILSVGGIAIISACVPSTLYDIVSANEIGVVVEPENSQALAAAIMSILNNNPNRINQKARWYAEKFLSLEKVLARYITQLD